MDNPGYMKDENAVYENKPNEIMVQFQHADKK